MSSQRGNCRWSPVNWKLKDSGRGRRHIDVRRAMSVSETNRERFTFSASEVEFMVSVECAVSLIVST